VIGAQAEVYTKEIEEAVDGETRSGQQGESKGELSDDERLPQAMATRSYTGAIAFFERFAGIDS
jgi:hypothetical protein